METGVLYIVATPIGNLEDLTFRAKRILEEVDYILCEDTRVTRKLLSHYGIVTKTRRYDAHATESTHEAVCADLQYGKRIALVSDAGTPLISDPGVLLVTRAREKGIRIEPIPGASALTAALSIAGISGNSFLFLGFVPHKKGRETFFKNLRTYDVPVIFYESTHRIMKTLETLSKTLPVTKHVTVARELTKMFEELKVGTPTEVLTYFIADPQKQKGEFVVLVSNSN